MGRNAKGAGTLSQKTNLQNMKVASHTNLFLAWSQYSSHTY